jgi:hypothetical protein
MDYFSLQNNMRGGNAKILAMEHLLSGPKPLIYGLFGAFGRPLIFLSDAMELQTAVLVVESLVLAAIDWDTRVHEILTHERLSSAPPELLSPEKIINQIAYDSRLSGVMKAGPGFQGVSHIFSSPTAKAALLEYVHVIDMRDIPDLLSQLSRLSVLLLCAAHKPEKPAFDLYLGTLPTLVNSAMVLLRSFEGAEHKAILVRGVWLLLVLAYITQLRPRMCQSLVASVEVPDDSRGDPVLAAIMTNPSALEGKYANPDFLRAARSIRVLGQTSTGNGHFFVQASWKLADQWMGWTGLGVPREETLDIRL